MQWLTVHVAGREYGLEMPRIRELAACSAVTRVPGSPRALRGLTALRGLPIPVVDLALRLAGRPVSIGARTPLVLVTARVDDDPIDVALLVEGAGRLIDLGAPLRPGPLDVLAPANVCTGFADVEGALVPLLDIDALVAKERLGEVAAPAPRAAPRTPAGAAPTRGSRGPATSSGEAPAGEAEAGRPEGRTAPPTPAPVAPAREADGSKQVRSSSARCRGDRSAGGQRRRLHPTSNSLVAEAPSRPLLGPSSKRPPVGDGAFPARTAARFTTSSEPWIRARIELARKEPPSGSTRQGALGWTGGAAALVAAVAIVIVLALALAGLRRDPAPAILGQDRREEDRPPAERPAPIATWLEQSVERTAGSGATEARSPTEPLVAAAPRGMGARAISAERPCEIHEIRTGETLWGIAGSRLGNPFRWPEVHARNRDLIANPDRISPHVRLRVDGACGERASRKEEPRAAGSHR